MKSTKYENFPGVYEWQNNYHPLKPTISEYLTDLLQYSVEKSNSGREVFDITANVYCWICNTQSYCTNKQNSGKFPGKFSVVSYWIVKVLILFKLWWGQDSVLGPKAWYRPSILWWRCGFLPVEDVPACRSMVGCGETIGTFLRSSAFGTL